MAEKKFTDLEDKELRDLKGYYRFLERQMLDSIRTGAPDIEIGKIHDEQLKLENMYGFFPIKPWRKAVDFEDMRDEDYGLWKHMIEDMEFRESLPIEEKIINKLQNE